MLNDFHMMTFLVLSKMCSLYLLKVLQISIKQKNFLLQTVVKTLNKMCFHGKNNNL